MPIVIPGEIEDLITIEKNELSYKFEGLSIEGVLDVISICLSIDDKHCEYYYLVELEHGFVLNYKHVDDIIDEEHFYVLHFGFGSPTIRELENNMLSKQKTIITDDGYRVTVKPGDGYKKCQPNWLRPKLIGPNGVKLISISYRCGNGGEWWSLEIAAPKINLAVNNENSSKNLLCL